MPKVHITLSGPNGFALDRTVFADEVEIGTVKPAFDYSGGRLPEWDAYDTGGRYHNRYVSDWAAAKQLALGLGMDPQ